LHAVSVWDDLILVATETGMELCQWNGKELVSRKNIKISEEIINQIDLAVNFKIVGASPNIIFTNNGSTFEINLESLTV
jgi:hypothetical protein